MANKLPIAFALAGVSQREVAAAIDMPEPNLSNLVNGKYRQLTVAAASKLSGYFGCSIEDLFPGDLFSLDSERQSVNS